MDEIHLEYAVMARELVCDETAQGIRIYIPFRRLDRVVFSCLMVPLFALSLVLSLWASLAVAQVLGRGVAIAVLSICGIVLLAGAIVFVLGLWSIRATILEYDGKVLRMQGGFGRRIREWPRETIRKVDVWRLPIVPIANMRVHIGYDEPVRVGIYHPNELREAARRLRQAMGIH